MSGRDRREDGAALLVTSLILVLLSTIAIASIDHAGQESAGGARARATSRTLHAADSGIQYSLHRVAQEPPNSDSFSFTLANNVTVESRTRTQPSPQDLAGLGLGPPPDGMQINVQTGYVSELFRANVTAASPAGSVAELEAKVSRLSVQ